MAWASDRCKPQCRRCATRRHATRRVASHRNGGSDWEPHPNPAHSSGLSGGLIPATAPRAASLGLSSPRDAPHRNGGGQPPHTPPFSSWLSGGLISVHWPPLRPAPLRSAVHRTAPLRNGSPSGLHPNKYRPPQTRDPPPPPPPNPSRQGSALRLRLRRPCTNPGGADRVREDPRLR